MINSLERISSKYKEDVRIIQCVRLFFQNQNEFRLKCIEMSKPHLKTYIGLMVEEKKYSEDVLFDAEYILKSMLTKIELISEHDVLNELLDILTLTILMTKQTENTLSPDEVVKEYIRELRFTDDGKMGALQLMVTWELYNIYPKVVVPSVQNSLLKLMFSETQVIQNRSLKLIRQIIEDEHHPALLDEVLSEIERNKNSKPFQCLTALCYLIDCVGFAKSHTNRPSFWLYLQQELLSTDRSVCKYALYVVRKFIEIYSNGRDENILNGSDFRASWDTFFLIQETLDEKQSNLILPVLEHLPKAQCLPMNWFYVLMTQLLRHENTLVLQSGLKYAIKNIRLDVQAINGDDVIKEFFTSLMNGLNNTFLYAKADFPIESLKDLFVPIVDIAFDIFLSINWKSVPMYYIVDSIVDLIFNRYRHSNEELAERFIKMLRLVNKLPNIKIRKGIQLNIQRSIAKISGTINVNTFSQLVQLACISTMKDMEFFNFDRWSHEDVCTLLGNQALDDEMKKKFLTRLEITDEDLLSLLKLMNMNGSSSFHIFEALASRHLHTLNIWLSNTLKNEELELEIILSMYHLFYVINDRQHDSDFVKSILPRIENKSTLTKLLRKQDVLNQKHLLECIYKVFSTCHDHKTSHFLNELISCGTESSILVALSLLEEHQDLLDETNLTDIMACVKDLQNTAIVTRFIEIIKLKKVSPFRSNLYPQLIQMTFNNNHLLSIVVDQFLQEDDTFLISNSKHIQNLLCHGIPLKGDQRVEYDLCQMILSDNSEWVLSSHIRFKLLFKLLNGFTGKNTSTFIFDLTNYLFQLSANLNLSKPRYYADSQQHRSKLRVIQALAMLISRSRNWDIRLQSALLNENNQPNVTFILELLIGRTIESSHLSKLLQEAKSNSARQSIFVIMYYVCSRLNHTDWASRYIENILPFTMGQHFNTRLFAQIAIVKIIEKFKMNTPKHQYNSVYQQIMHSFGQGNAKQISDKFLQDFRFTCIDCTDLLNPVYILCEIPRVTQMAKDELIPLSIVQCDGSDQFTFKEPFHVNINLCGVHNENVDVDNANDNVQKKIIPVKNIVPDANLLETLPNYSKSIKEPNKEGIIVVASLVSRSPNLGGLSRTCEIFGVQQLILESLKQIENKEFQSLSMTSEKWLNIGEVKSWQLYDYLVTMKSNGYFIVGAEQTANGKKLTDLKFPKKTVVLLGHEKDGVPANLLSVLDAAVEIPQIGVVRSLNVHVSGAIFVWEYAKQHSF